MKTKLLLSSSAFCLAILGNAATFLPQEILAAGGVEPNRISVLLVQVLGAAYLGFAMLNWMNRDNLMGGIYSRPAALGNLFHFVVVTITLIKAVSQGMTSPSILAATALYGIFAIWFGLVLWTHPIKSGEGPMETPG